MRYLNAEDVLPAELLEQVQRYADGIYLYIPRRADHRSAGAAAPGIGRSCGCAMNPSGICTGRVWVRKHWQSGFTFR